MAVARHLVQQTILNLVNSGSQIPTWILTEFQDGEGASLRHPLRLCTLRRCAASVVVETAYSEELKLEVESLRFDGGNADAEEQALLGRDVIHFK